MYGHAPMIEALVKAGAVAKQRGPNGERMVMFGARSGSPQALKVLIGGGADVNAKENLRGTTALMWAAEQRHPAAVKMLLEVGADYGAKTGPAGLPRNYMAPRVNTAAVRDAARRYAAAAAAGRTYEQQLEYEASQGMKISLGFRGVLNAGGQRTEGAAPPPGPAAPNSGARPSSAARVPPAQAPTPTASGAPPAPEGDDGADVILAGLVGSGGGGLTP